MPDERGVVREIAWRDCFPWLRLFDTLRLSLKLRMLVPAVVGVLLSLFGWWLIGRVFSGSEDPRLKAWIASYASCPWEAGDANGLNRLSSSIGPGGPFDPATIGEFPAGASPLASAWWTLSAPARQLFDLRLTYVGLAYLLLCLFWGVAVWALFGGALSRMAAMQLGREESIGWSKAFAYARTKWTSYFSAPLLPLVGVLLTALPMALAGLLLRGGSVGALVAAIAWPLLLAGGALMVVFLVGLCFGWPLMWAAISTEGTDNFDALSRSYSYVYQRPLKYLGYAVVATLLSVLGGAVALGLTEAVVHLTNWAAGWGAGQPVDDIIATGRQAEGFASWGPSIIWFWNGCVRLAALGFVYSYFWTATSAIYLLLRQDVDGTEHDEVYVDDGGEAFGMPALAKDEAGVPVVADEEAETPS